MSMSLSVLKKIGGVFTFALTAGIAVAFIDYQDLSINNNLWQYIMIIIACIGCAGIFLFSNLTANKRRKGIIVVWFLSILYFFYILASSIIFKETDWRFWLLAVLLVASTSLNLWESRNK